VTPVKARRHIQVSGLVQGVGFRPFVYRLATEARLSGSVMNTASGVTIEIEGPQERLETFLARLREDAPPLSRITHVVVADVSCIEDRDFSIVESNKDDHVHTLISPDVATCDDCLREMLDPTDRRFRYPFINCTNCGPRFTIVRSIPYDRPGTSMAAFQMCAACQAEYDDPRSRRFHAQPNACWDCGPRLELRSSEGELTAARDPIAETIALLRAGHIVAIKGVGGFHLAADALNAAVIERLRERKHRIEKPFAVMVANLETAEQFCVVNPAEREALQSFERPIVLLRKKSSCAIPEQAAPRIRDLGFFLPYAPLHHLLFAECGFQALVMTSGNASEEPIAIDNGDALARLRGLADFFLVHNRDILLRCDDSVVRVAGNRMQHLRRSRGFVPAPVFLHREMPAVLAVGGELKNAICIAEGNQAFLSQHIGDLENLAGLDFFEEAIGHLEQILEIDPKIVAYDLHPDYLSTKWALQQRDRVLVGVQHHHAHVASCMAENHLDGTVIGFALDGTGFGTDGHIWGGEVLIADYRKFTRAAHFEYVPMPGGAAAIREPWRMAVSYLNHFFGPDFRKMRPPFLEETESDKIDLVVRMLNRHVNSPLTSSCGRLFDAVASLAGLRHTVNYEAQAAIELEMALDPAINDSPQDDAYSFDLTPGDDGWIIGMKPMFQSLIEDLNRSVTVGVISRRFHNGLVDVLRRTAGHLREEKNLDRVCLSGGTFNNVYLSQQMKLHLESDGFLVFTHREVPCGDGGLSLGQAMIAAHRQVV
jgi:hydrogenase maturation protein HypF